MALQYSAVPEVDFSLGIDTRSAENQIDPGFVRDLLNADIVERRVRKRKGYQGFAGNIPVRVTEVEYDDPNNQICFTLASSVSLESVASSPIVVYGRTTSEFVSGDGPFYDTADNVKYYPGFTIPIRRLLVAGTGTLTIAGSEHSLETSNLFVSVVESLSTVNRSYSQVFVDSISIDEGTFDISIDYTVASDTPVFVLLADKDTVTGESYAHTATVGTGVQTVTITAGTHALNNFNIIAEVYQDLGSDDVQIFPDSVEVASNGTVTVTVNNGTGSSIDLIILLSSAPIPNVLAGVVDANSTGTVIIPDVTTPWIFYSIYLEQTPGGTKEQVLPDSIIYDDTTQEVTLTFINGSSSARNFIIFFEYGELRSNQLCVTDSTLTTSGIDTRPQLTIWGLDHSEIYESPKTSREGWATHIDSYRRSGEQRLVCGLGGNLFSARTYSEAGSQYAYPRLYPNLNTRTSTSLILGPTFWDTGETPARSRGYITCDPSGTNWVRATAVEYDSGTGWTKYTLSTPNMAILDSSGSPTVLGSVISTTTDLEDWLTITDMSYSVHGGIFKIRQVTSGVNEIYVWVENESNSADYNDSGTGGQAGIFTDRLTWSVDSPYITGDSLLSDALESTALISALSSSGMSTLSDGWVDLVEIPAGVLFIGQRVSDVIPLRISNPTATASTTNLVRGDMLSYSDIPRLLRVLHINPDSDRSLSISSEDGVVTCTLLSGDTGFLTVGMRVLLTQASTYSAVVEISDVISDTEFQFETSDQDDTVTSGILVGETAQIDEQLDWTDTLGDTSAFTVEARWIPIEAPDDAFDLTPSTYISHFDSAEYIRQSFLRSTMVVDNMYYTNDADEVAKFDGSSVYRAGIIPWQAGLFTTQETTGATIVTNLRSVAYSARVAATGSLTITFADTNIIPLGSSVRLTGSTQTYTVRGYSDDGTDYYILMDRALDAGVSATGTVAEIGTYRYYHRLNAVDINGNIIASATTGYQDHVVELTGNAAIQHKVIGLPAWDNYDYDRLEFELYRTKLNQAAPFYKVTTLPMSFDNTQGYIVFRDSFADSDLTELDVVNTALKGAELGTAWSDPLRAKYVTSLGNRLVLGNTRDYPQLDIQVIAPATVANTDFAGDTLLFRRDSTDAGTTTNMVDRVKFEWKNGTTGTASNFVIGTDEFTFDTSTNTAAVVGDWIYLTYSTVATAGRQVEYSGWYQIESSTATTVTCNLVGAVAAAAYPNRYVIATDPTDVPVLLGVDGNLGMVNGDSFDIFDAMRRMSMAINSVMRQVDISLTGMDSFVPWLTARGGNDTPPAGRLIVRQPRESETTIELVPTFSGYSLFVNSVKRATGNQISANTRIYPSRILVSYENYPEIFDNPTSILDTDSDSAIDINSADGQEITGIIPFFGEAAFGAAQQSAILVVFKSNSIYLVDINQKLQGLNAVQRIETEGLGCTAPYSIAVTKGGIMFANESGIYCLRRNQAIEYIGKYMERNWTERVDLSMLDIVQGHHYGVGRAYKLSIPLSDPDSDYIENSEVYVYNHTGESEGKSGAWGRYDNHPATGWANLASDAFFSSSNGRVFSIRVTGENTDFRDDSSAINMTLQTRPTDFGNSEIRKVVDKVVVNYRAGSRNIGTSLNYSIDLEEEYQGTTQFVVPRPTQTSGLSDMVGRDVVTISHAVGRRRCIYFSTEITNATLDENIEIAGITYKVGGLGEQGILQAAQTE